MNTMKTRKSAGNLGGGGGGGNRNSAANCLKGTSKPILMLATVIVATLLVTACPPPEETVDAGGYIPPNANPSTQLASLSVVYPGQSENLITFDGNAEDQAQAYETDAPTDANQSTVTVKARAKSASAKVQITFTYGFEFGGTQEGTKQEDELKLIPIPTTQENTFVYITVTNTEGGEDVSFEYVVTIAPPNVDTTLKTLTVALSTDPSVNRIAYNSKISLYEVNIPNTTPPDATIIVTAEKNDPLASEPVIANNNIQIPSAGSGDRKLITVLVEKDGMSSLYKINIIPAQNALQNDATLQNLQFAYQSGGNNIPAIPDFTPARTEYNLAVDSNNVTTVKLTAARANSSKAKSIVVTQGTASQSPYANGIWAVDSSDAREIAGTQSAISLPQKGSDTTLTFLITVTAANDAQITYRVNITNPIKLDTYSGTAQITDTANANGKVLDHVEMVGENGQTVSSNTITNGDWVANIDSRIAPVAFVVVLKKTVGANTIIYKQSIPNTFATKDNIGLSVVVGNSARTIYNAQDFYAMGAAGNNTENWYLNNDIVLPDSDAGWTGPQGYSGHFYGNGHSITNLKIKAANGDIGLFSSLDGGAVVENFTLDIDSAAGLRPDSGAVHFCFGGVIGRVATDQTTPITIDKVRVTGSIDIGAIKSGSGVNVIIGGLVGLLSTNNKSPLVISNCISEVNIKAALGSVSNGQTGQQVFGGLIGKTAGSAGANITIKNSGATGTIDVSNKSTPNFFAGGLVGYGDETGNSAVIKIENCYTKSTVKQVRSDVAGNSSSTNISVIGVGGIAGKFAGASGSYIKNSCVLGPYVGVTDSVTGKSNANRIVGVFITTGSTLSGNRANSAMTLLPVLSSRGNDHDTWNGLGTGLNQTGDIITTLNTNAPNTWRWDNEKSMPVLVQ